MVRIHKREVDFSPSVDVSSLEIESVMESLKSAVGYELQLGQLLQDFGITLQMVNFRVRISFFIK